MHAPVCVQAVQVELKSGEKTDKDDDSPVTVADYGAQVGKLSHS
jgi:3'-phosphoadenosine 5'-phosphosulfate (PAPS) 3'-phosphatase